MIIHDRTYKTYIYRHYYGSVDVTYNAILTLCLEEN